MSHEYSNPAGGYIATAPILTTGHTTAITHAPRPSYIGEYNAVNDCVWDGSTWVPAGKLAQGLVRRPPPANVEMIEMRLREKHGFDFLEAISTNLVVFVFIVHNGQAQIIEDDPHLFPSDKLITQLRLLK